MPSEFIFRDKKGRAVGGANMPVTTKDPTMIRVYRDEISRHLIDEARRLYPEAITFHFDAPISGVDFEKRVVSISGSKAPQEVCSMPEDLPCMLRSLAQELAGRVHFDETMSILPRSTPISNYVDVIRITVDREA